jgi:hypothetical protein
MSYIKTHWQSSYKRYKKVQVKEREEKQARKVANAQWATTKVVQKIVDKIAKVKFVIAWSIVAVS